MMLPQSEHVGFCTHIWHKKLLGSFVVYNDKLMNNTFPGDQAQLK